MQRYCLTLDLRPDPGLIAEYVEHHRVGRETIHASIRDAGVLDMQIYHLNGRLFMIMETTDDFTFERKAEMDKANPEVQAWEALMSRFQDVGSDSDLSNRWQLMERIFVLNRDPKAKDLPTHVDRNCQPVGLTQDEG
jgi:L-rhamnose mutarotase